MRMLKNIGVEAKLGINKTDERDRWEVGWTTPIPWQ